MFLGLKTMISEPCQLSVILVPIIVYWAFILVGSGDAGTLSQRVALPTG